MKRTSTYFPKPGETGERWRVIDAQGQTLGRLARNIAIALQGKDKTTFTPHVATGDFVVVTNASDMRVTGNKLDQKMYYRHSGYVGNLKTFRLREMMESRPDRVLELAVKPRSQVHPEPEVSSARKALSGRTMGTQPSRSCRYPRSHCQS